MKIIKRFIWAIILSGIILLPTFAAETDIAEEVEIIEEERYAAEEIYTEEEELYIEIIPEEEVLQESIAEEEIAIEEFAEESAIEEIISITLDDEEETSGEVINIDETGLVYDDTLTWRYYEKGVFKKATGLVQKYDSEDEQWYYVKDGVKSEIDTIARRVGESGSDYYRVKDGIAGEYISVKGYTDEIMTISPLADCAILTDSRRDRGDYEITRITIHHMAAVWSGKNCAQYFYDTDAGTSTNYCIGVDGDIVCSVIEEYGSVTSGNRESDRKAICIEISDIDTNYNKSSDASMESLYCLLVDLFQRYPSLGGKMIYTGDESGNLTYHKMVSTSGLDITCPGEWMIFKMPEIAAEVNRRLGIKATQTIQMSESEIVLGLGETAAITAEILPKESNQKVNWYSSNEEVATVQDGIVTAVSKGEAIIRATTADGDVYCDCRVLVNFKDFAGLSETFREAINWISDKGIANGYADGYFGQADACTRKQFAIMLYRYSGKQAVSGEMPFSDCQKYGKNSDSYKAILWASQKGIVKGCGDGTFGPDNDVTRQQVMIMLYRYAGKPSVSGNLGFDDVAAKPGSDTYNAILWGSKMKITKGTSNTTFSPYDNCLRRQIALFLYRYNNTY